MLVGVIAGLLTGCGAPQSTLDPGGPAAKDIATLSWIVFIVFLAVTAAMWVLIGLAAGRRRGNFAEHAPVDTGGGQGWVLIGGFAIPFVILAVIFVLGLRVMAGFPMHDGGHDEPPDIRIIGRQWWWELQYIGGPVDQHFTTANELHIPVGRPVDIELRSADVIHSFWVPRLQGKMDLVPGQPNHMRLRADTPGVYQGQCAEYCGAQHAHMRILVVAEPPNDYDAWRSRALHPANEPVTDEQKLGQQVFMSSACALCHTIAGTPAQGLVGPNLTHIASRRGLAANTLENNEANLAAWVTHAQSLKPEAAMPNLTQFTGTQLRALAAYLRHLR
jgi:cytochrome c oxidase subunit 2